jgi:hypothetical protein
VHVCVLEAGQEEPAAEVDHLGAITGQREDLRVEAYGHDPVRGDRHRLDAAPGRIDRVDDAVDEQQMCVAVVAH